VTFSSRFHWGFEANRLTRILEQKRRDDAPIVDLTGSNPTLVGFAYPRDIVQAFADERLLRYDPASLGTREAREAVARYYARRGIGVEPERILLTASTSEAYSYLFKLLTDPGDHVLVPRPSYPLFEFLANMESIEARPYPLVYQGRWSIDLDALAAAITPRTRAIILVNPNSPTGSYLKRAEFDELSKLCTAHRIALISDEVFADYPFRTDSERVRSLADATGGLVFAMGGLSKAAGLPQMKLGWLVVAGTIEERRQALERLEWIADTYLSVGTPVQCAAARLLEAGESVQSQIRERTRENFGFVREVFESTSATVLDVEGGWSAVLQVPRVRTEEEWAVQLLTDYNVLVQPGYFYDFASEAFLVVSLLTPPDTFRQGIERHRTLLECA
jgi:aspartate/methionine/tyrosine aminotransferase